MILFLFNYLHFDITQCTVDLSYLGHFELINHRTSSYFYLIMRNCFNWDGVSKHYGPSAYYVICESEKKT